jgi:hypothetical protein
MHVDKGGSQVHEAPALCAVVEGSDPLGVSVKKYLREVLQKYCMLKRDSVSHNIIPV